MHRYTEKIERPYLFYLQPYCGYMIPADTCSFGWKICWCYKYSMLKTDEAVPIHLEQPQRLIGYKNASDLLTWHSSSKAHSCYDKTMQKHSNPCSNMGGLGEICRTEILPDIQFAHFVPHAYYATQPSFSCPSKAHLQRMLGSEKTSVAT